MELLLCALFQYRKASVDQVKLGGVGGTLLTEDELNGAGTRRDVVFIGQAHVLVDHVYDSMQVRILGADGRTSTGDMDKLARQCELAQTGWLAYKGRKTAAHFLTFDLWMDWRIGAFHDQQTLFDYDFAMNYEKRASIL